MELLQRIGKNVTISPNGCWEWNGATSRGYGSISISNSKKQTHRVVYEALVYDLTTGNQVHHLCENRSCLNPSHLHHTKDISHHQSIHRHNVCLYGHRLEGDNLIIVVRRNIEERRCKKCHQQQALKSWHKRHSVNTNG